jgi:hypothetical protein
MPVVPLIWFGAGALAGGGGVWFATDAAKKVANAALIFGGVYLGGKYLKAW